MREYWNIVFTIFFRSVVFLYKIFHKRLDKAVYVGFSSAWFGGNVKGLIDHLLNEKDLLLKKKIHIYFTSPNKEQIEISKKAGVDAYWWHDLNALPVFSKTKSFVTAHGESFLPVTRRGKLKDFLNDVVDEFVYKINPDKTSRPGGSFSVKRMELWHGIPFKDVYIDKVPLPPDIFCVTSEFMKKCYSKKSYNPDIFRITGYPRNDILFKKINRNKIFSKLNIPSNKKIILYAPTWGHLTGKGLFPWENWKDTFILLNKFAEESSDAFFIIRTHRYWEGGEGSDVKNVLSQCSNIGWVSMEMFPDTYSLLAVTDVLITDWSSIAFDFMLKRKPIIFIDCPNPYRKFCFTPEERAGAIVKNPDELINAIKDSLKDSSRFIDKYAPNFNEVMDKAFLYKDGKASERCIKELLNLLKG